MKLWAAIPLALWTTSATAQECVEGSTCVPPEDMQVFVKLLQEKKCLLDNPPTFKLDPITITTDEEGRTYYTGAQPHPYTVKMAWCDYEVTGQGDLNVVVARKEPEEWGWRFRLKFYTSFLFVDAFEEYGDDKHDPSQAIDAGLQVDFFHWRFINLNAGVGFRSVNASVGFDFTRNFGAFAGYSFSFWTLKHNPTTGLFFSFW